MSSPKIQISLKDILFFTLFISSLTIIVPVYGGDELIVQPPDTTHDKEVICHAILKVDENIKVEIENEMSYDDLLRLTVWNSKYNLRSGEKIFNFTENVNWKRNILTRLISIFKKTCPTEFVDPGYIQMIQELFMIYQNSLDESNNHLEMWQPLLDVLDSCEDSTKAMDMVSSGFKLTGIKLPVEDGQEEVAIMVPEEIADSSGDIDIIIDTIWWLFSFSFGNCYYSSTNPSHWAALYKRMFYADFLLPLKNRWLHAGSNTEFGVIFGDFPYETLKQNIRTCVTGAYMRNGLADRQLVRSLILAMPGAGIEAGLNKKLGKRLTY